MKDRPLTTQNKDKGLIETGWIEMAATERSYGVFGRQAFDDRERAKMNVLLTRNTDGIEVSALETRQRWHLRGGGNPASHQMVADRTVGRIDEQRHEPDQF